MVTAKQLQDVIDQINASYAGLLARLEELEKAKKPPAKEKSNKA